MKHYKEDVSFYSLHITGIINRPSILTQSVETLLINKLRVCYYII